MDDTSRARLVSDTQRAGSEGVEGPRAGGTAVNALGTAQMAAGFYLSAEIAGGVSNMQDFYGMARSSWFRQRRQFKAVVGKPAEEATWDDVRDALRRSRRAH
jgi:hypothetical protein